MAELTRHRARKVFAHRGQVASGDRADKEIIPAWRASKNHEGVRYKINYDHPAIRTVIDNAGDLLPAIKAMLQTVQETVPIQRIWLDTEEQKDTPRNRFSNDPPENLKQVLEDLFLAMTEYQGLSALAAVKQLKQTDPFQEYPDIVDSLLNNSMQ
jgi:predicted Abi (CAAX) family protease